MEPSEIRSLVLIWLYERASFTSLPQAETAILNGLKREGSALELPQLREALDFMADPAKAFVTVHKGNMGGGRSSWGWTITAKGKEERESWGQ